MGGNIGAAAAEIHFKEPHFPLYRSPGAVIAARWGVVFIRVARFQKSSSGLPRRTDNFILLICPKCERCACCGGFTSSIQTGNANEPEELSLMVQMSNRFLDHTRVDYSIGQARAAHRHLPLS